MGIVRAMLRLWKKTVQGGSDGVLGKGKGVGERRDRKILVTFDSLWASVWASRSSLGASIFVPI